MATALQNLINAYIKRNANQEITGPVLNGVLTAIANALGTPFVGSDGYWYTYDAETGQFVKTDTPAQGETGPVGVTEAAATIDDQIGTPSVAVSLDGTRLDFTFRNLKGQKGDTGDAGITAAVVTVDAGIGTPSVDASITGTTLTLAFHNLKGETGAAAGFGTIEATVEDTTGTPAVVVTTSGPDTAKNLSFAFSGLKGPKGDQGNTGVSADYPITIANNLTTDDPTAALAASQGVVLKGEIDQLGQELNNQFSGRIGFGDSQSSIVPEDLLQYTDQYGTASLNTPDPAYLWICMESDGWGAVSFGVEIPMQYVGIINGLYCFVSDERLVGMVEFNPVKRHKVKSDSDRLVIIARSYTIKYGDPLPTFGYTANGEVEGAPTISCQATQTSGVGEYAIVITRGTVTDDTAVYENGTLTIEKAELTVTADNKYVELGGTMPALTLQYAGFVNGEDASDLTTAPTCTTTAQGTAVAGGYRITPSGGVAANYEFVYVNGVLTVGYVLQYTKNQLSDSGSCGGYIGAPTSTYANLWRASTDYTGIIIDIRKYKGATLRIVPDPERLFVRFAFLTGPGFVADHSPAFSSVAGYTGIVQIDYASGDSNYDVPIPTDANFMYLYTNATTSYVGPEAVQLLGIVSPTMQMKNLPASLFATTTTINAQGQQVTGASAICSDYLTANEYAYLSVLKFLANRPPTGGTVNKVFPVYYDPNKVFIRRDTAGAQDTSSVFADAHPFQLPPSCGFLRIIVYQYNGTTSMGGSEIRFDGDALQTSGTES